MAKLTKSQVENIENALVMGAGFIGEWRGAIVEHIEWGARSASEGQKAREAGSMTFITHTIEVGDGAHLRSYSVRVRQSEGLDPKKINPTLGLTKGGLVFCVLEKFITVKGQTEVEASELFLLDAPAAANNG